MSELVETGLPGLEIAVLQTAAYADVFDFPLTSDEIHRYLIGTQTSQEVVDQFLQKSLLLSRVDSYFTLPGREMLAVGRRRREQEADRLWPKALFYGRIIARLPFIRMVAVTGALAMNNVKKGADIDYLLVTEPGHLWSCRALVLLVGRLAALQGITLCPNYLVSLRALDFPDQTLYAAHEIAQMIPIAGLGVYHRVREQNSWAARFLPNASGLPGSPWISPQKISNSPTRSIVEAVFRTKPAAIFEQWEMSRKIHKLRREQAFSPESHFSTDCCKGHAHRHQANTQVALDERLKHLQQESFL